MKLSTATNHKNRLANQMRSIYACAVYDRPSHRDLVARVSEGVWADPALKRCPSWVYTALMEVRHSLAAQVYAHLVWAFIGSDGVPRQLDDLTESDRQAVFAGTLHGGHYWLKSDRRTETLPDGRIVETITKTPTVARY
jgi:hypothetical protein